MPKSYKPLPLVLVEWDDSASYVETGWKKSHVVLNDLTPGRIFSVGWVLKKTKRYLTLVAHGSNEHREVQGEMSIPRGCIRSVKRLRILK